MVLTVSDMPKRAKRGGKRRPLPTPKVTQETRGRIYAEAQQHPAFEGMEPGALREYIDGLLAECLSKYPWWFGHIDDARLHAAKRQYKARRDKERLKAPVKGNKGPTVVGTEPVAA